MKNPHKVGNALFHTNPWLQKCIASKWLQDVGEVTVVRVARGVATFPAGQALSICAAHSHVNSPYSWVLRMIKEIDHYDEIHNLKLVTQKAFHVFARHLFLSKSWKLSRGQEDMSLLTTNIIESRGKLKLWRNLETGKICFGSCLTSSSNVMCTKNSGK